MAKRTKQIVMPNPVDGENLMVSDQDFGKLQGKVDSIAETLDKFDRILFGNGQEGLLTIVKNNDKQLTQVITTISKMSDKVDTFSKNINEVSEKIENHIIDPRRTFKGFITDNWKGIIFLFVSGFLLLHAILPPEFTLWKLFENLLK